MFDDYALQSSIYVQMRLRRVQNDDLHPLKSDIGNLDAGHQLEVEENHRLGKALFFSASLMSSFFI